MAAIVLPSAVAPVAILFMAPLSSNINSWATAPMSSRNVRLGLSEVLGAAVAHICFARRMYNPLSTPRSMHNLESPCGSAPMRD